MEYPAPWKSRKGTMYIFSWKNTSKIPQGEQENWEKIDSKSVGWGLFISKVLLKYCHDIEFSIKYPLETIVFLITVTECHPSTRTLAHSKFKCKKKKKKKAKFGDAFHVIHPISFHVQILHLRLNFEWQWNIAWFYSNFIYFFFWSGLMGRI